MPQKMTAEAGWNDTLDLPRDGEAIDAADVNAPMRLLLGNDKHLIAQVALGNVVRLASLGVVCSTAAPVGDAQQPGRAVDRDPFLKRVPNAGGDTQDLEPWEGGPVGQIDPFNSVRRWRKIISSEMSDCDVEADLSHYRLWWRPRGV